MTNQPEDKCPMTATYQSYLIRIWKDGAEALWRASAQSVQSGQPLHFANLTELFAFLEAQTAVDVSPHLSHPKESQS